MPKGVMGRYERGSQPLDNAADAMAFDKLLAAWEESSKRVDAGLTALTPEFLDTPAPSSPTNNPNETVRSLLTAITWHQAYHVGQTGILRRITGKNGAIQ